MVQNTTKNPLETEPVGRLIAKFAIPAIISMLVSSLYNIVDQISMAIVQIKMNNTLRYYGADSMYGADIPLACVGGDWFLFKFSVFSKADCAAAVVAIGLAMWEQKKYLKDVKEVKEDEK